MTRSSAAGPTAFALTVTLALALSAPAAFAAEEASARFVDRDGEEIGQALLTEGPHGVLIHLELEGLPPGPHGIHIHSVGTCDDHEEGFSASGGHVNPEGREHGLLNPNGPDAGDLPNIFAHDDGSVTVELFTTLATLAEGEGRAPLLDDDGSALVIHEGRDDHLSQPIGGAGARIACGVIEAPM